MLLVEEQVEQRAKNDYLILHDKNVTCCAVSSSRWCVPVRWWCQLLCWLLLVTLCTALLVGFLQAEWAPFDSRCSSASDDVSHETSATDDVVWSGPQSNVTEATPAFGTNLTTTTPQSDHDNKETPKRCVNFRKFFAGKWHDTYVLVQNQIQFYGLFPDSNTLVHDCIEIGKSITNKLYIARILH